VTKALDADSGIQSAGSSTSPGRFVLVLHTHLPWLKHAGTWPFGEEWLFQAWGESYLPILHALETQHHKGHNSLLTLGLTPLITAQMADPGLLERFETWLQNGMLRCETLMANAGRERGEFADRRRVGRFLWEGYHDTLEQFRGNNRELLPSFRRAVCNGTVELLGGPLSHPYLALHDDTTARAQVRLGLDETERLLGIRPRGIWLPECAYRPGIENALAATGVEYFMLDGPTLLACEVPHALRRVWQVGDSPVCVMGRDLDVAYRVWSPTGGYPGHGNYREYHRLDSETGLKAWRVTDKELPGPEKAFYDPEKADTAIDAHVEDFTALLHSSVHSSEDIVVACYDTELFGHWWFEGPTWLNRLLDRLANDDTITPCTFGQTVDSTSDTAHTTTHTNVAGQKAQVTSLDKRQSRRVFPPASSWGLGKDFSIWENEKTASMWKTLHQLEERFRSHLAQAEANLDAAHPDTAHPTPVPSTRTRLLLQGFRELCLAQCSDWPFLIGHNSNADYARGRFDAHASAAARCFDAIDAPEQDLHAHAPAPSWLVTLEKQHDLAPDLTLAGLSAALS